MKFAWSMVAAFLLLLVSQQATFEQVTPPPAVCVWGQVTINGLKIPQCLPPSRLGIVGPTGAQGPQGPAGPAGASGSALIGGPCSNADNSLGLFIQLPNGSCLPVIITGATVTTAGMTDTQGNPVAGGITADVVGLALLANDGVTVTVRR